MRGGVPKILQRVPKCEDESLDEDCEVLTMACPRYEDADHKDQRISLHEDRKVLQMTCPQYEDGGHVRWSEDGVV